MRKMRENGESIRTNSLLEEKTDKVTSESKMKSSSPDEKFSLPSIHPTVIQALPSVRQALPSLQPAVPLSLPKIQSKGKKAPRRPKSGVKRKLPSIPTPEKLTLPSIQANAATSVKKTLPFEEQAKPSAQLPDTKVRPTVKLARRILPSIPPPEDLALPSIEPTAVEAQPKIIVLRRRRRMLPILPTIIEQRTPTPEEDATEIGVEPAKNGGSQNTEAKEKDGMPTPQSVMEETQKSVQPAEKEELLSQKEELKGIKPKPRTPAQRPQKISKGTQTILQSEVKEKSGVPSPQSVVKETDKSLESAVKEALPSQKEELQGVRPEPKAPAQRPRKISKETQTILQSAKEKVMPSLKPIKEKSAEDSGSGEPHLKAQATREDNATQPSDQDTLVSVQDKRKPVPNLSVKEELCDVKLIERESPQSSYPSMERVLPRHPMTRSARAIRQMARAKELSVPPLKLEHGPAARRVKFKPSGAKAEPLSSIKGKVRQTKTIGDTLSSPQHTVELKPPRLPGPRRMKSEKPVASVQGKIREAQEKTKALFSPQHAPERKTPRPPNAARFSPQATDLEPLGSVQGPVRQTQTKGEALLCPKPPPARRNKVSPPETKGETLGSVQGAIGQTQTKGEGLFCPRPPPTRRNKVSPPQTKGETLGSFQGTIGQTQTKGEGLFCARPAQARRNKVSPPKTEEGEALKSFKGTLGQTQTKSEVPLSQKRSLEDNFPMAPAARQIKASPPVVETEVVPSSQSSKKETPPNSQPKPGSYAFLNLKRREFEALQRLELMAKEFRSNARPMERGSQSRDLLTVKPALPGIKPTQEATAVLRPHPPAGTKRKGLPSVKRPHTKFRAKLVRELPSLQPTVKQALPSISSANLHTLVKQPLPSVQPEERFTEESDEQLPGLERQEN